MNIGKKRYKVRGRKEYINCNVTKWYIYICIKRNDVTSSQDIEEIKKYEVKIKTKMNTTGKSIEISKE